MHGACAAERADRWMKHQLWRVDRQHDLIDAAWQEYSIYRSRGEHWSASGNHYANWPLVVRGLLGHRLFICGLCFPIRNMA